MINYLHALHTHNYYNTQLLLTGSMQHTVTPLHTHYYFNTQLLLTGNTHHMVTPCVLLLLITTGIYPYGYIPLQPFFLFSLPQIRNWLNILAKDFYREGREREGEI